MVRPMMYSLVRPIAWPSSSGLGSAAGSEAAASLLQEDKNAWAGLGDGLAEVDRRDARLLVAFGILCAREPDMRIDLALEFLLNGLKISSLGESTGDSGWSIVFPSGIVCGGDTVVFPVRLPMLPPIALVSGGEASTSLMGDIVDADVRDAVGGTCW
jgi:hypothetical protein